MKRYILILVLILIFMQAFAKVDIRSIRAHDYDGIISRIVIELSAAAHYTVEPESGGKSFRIMVYDAIPGSFIPQYSPSAQILRSINISNNDSAAIIKLQGEIPCTHLSLSLENPHRIVIDIISRQIKGKKEKLVLADFYHKTGRLQRADDVLSNLAEDYPTDAEVLFAWAEVLSIRDKKNKAIEKLSLIPSSSSLYQAAASMMEKLQGRETAAPLLETVSEADSSIAILPDSSMETKPIVQSKTRKIRSRGCPLPAVLLRRVLIILFAAALLFLLLRNAVVAGILQRIFLLPLHLLRKKDIDDSADESDDKAESSAYLDDNTKVRMVERLAHDGWSVKEIAIELHLSRKEVHHLMQQSSSPKDSMDE